MSIAILAFIVVALFLILGLDTLDSDLRVAGKIQVGSASSPPDIDGGTGAMDATNKANGSIWLRSDADTTPEIMHNGAVEALGLRGNAIECRIGTLTANTANSYTTYLPRGAVITGVKRRYTAVPASAAGTVLAQVTLAGNHVLASSSENEEGLTNDTLTAHSLTGTGANLKGTAGQKIVITITSNNADMTGGTVCIYYIYYNDN